MSVGKSILEGSVVSRNAAPRMPVNSTVVLKGKMNGKSAMIGLDEDLLSKQMLLVGGTGCGKSTLFYHMIRQLKDKMTDDDVMIILIQKEIFIPDFLIHPEITLLEIPVNIMKNQNDGIYLRRSLQMDGKTSR